MYNSCYKRLSHDVLLFFIHLHKLINMNKLFFFIMIHCLLICIVACQDDSSSQQVPPPPKKIKPKPFVLSGNPHQISLRNHAVVMMGGFNIIDDVNQKLQNISQKLVQRIDLKTMWLNNFVKNELLLQPQHVNGKRPLRFLQMMQNEKLHRVYLLGVKNPKEFLKFVQESTQKLSLDTLTIYQRSRFKEDRDPLFFHLLGDMLMVTRTKKLLDRTFHSLYKSLYIARFEGVGGVHTYPERLLALWQGNANEHMKKQLDQWQFKGDEASQKRQKIVSPINLCIA